MDTKTMTIKEALDDTRFSYFFNKEINAIRKRRISILEKAAGLKPRFKSNAFSTLDRMEMLKPSVIKNEYYLIFEKKSELTKRERDWIEDLIKTIIGSIILYYDDENDRIGKRKGIKNE